MYLTTRSLSVVEGSDIDFLVELEKGTGLLKFSRIKIDLEGILNTRVDLISLTGVSKYIKPHIDQDKVLVYEADNSPPQKKQMQQILKSLP